MRWRTRPPPTSRRSPSATRCAGREVHVGGDRWDYHGNVVPDQPVPSAGRAPGPAPWHRDRCWAFDLNAPARAGCMRWRWAAPSSARARRTAPGRHRRVAFSRITNPNDHGTAFLFGDGAGAAVLVDAAGGHRLNRMNLSGDASFFDAIQRSGGGAMRLCRRRNGDDLHHFYLQMNGAVVFKMP